MLNESQQRCLLCGKKLSGERKQTVCKEQHKTTQKGRKEREGEKRGEEKEL